jgi:hypothetical protein
MKDKEKLLLLNVIAISQLQVFMIDELNEAKLAMHEVKMRSAQLHDAIIQKHGHNIKTLWSFADGDLSNRALIDFYVKVVSEITASAVNEVQKQINEQFKITETNEQYPSNSDNLS